MSHPANGLNRTLAKLPSHPATRAEDPEDANGLHDLRGGEASASGLTLVLSVPVSDIGGAYWGLHGTCTQQEYWEQEAMPRLHNICTQDILIVPLAWRHG
jgi:hypothetical protein